MQWNYNGEVQIIPFILCFMMKTLKTILKGSLPLNKSRKGGQDQAHVPTGLSAFLTSSPDWEADTATPITDA